MRALVRTLLLVVAAGVGLWWLARTDDVRLFALTADTGRVRWSVGLPYGTRVVGNPVVGDGRVVVSTAGPELFGSARDDLWRMTAFDARSGRERWSYEPPRDRSSPIDPVAFDLPGPYPTADRVFARVETRGGATLLVLDAATGRQAWRADQLDYGLYSRHTDVVVSNGRALVPTWHGNELELHALQEDDGSEVWRVTFAGATFAHSGPGPFLAASSETFYVGLTDGVVALDVASGAERFRIAAPPAEDGGQIALVDGVLFRRTGLLSITAYDPVTGRERWTYRPPLSEAWSGGLRSFSVRNGLLAAYCACEAVRGSRIGWLLAVDADTGADRWRVPVDPHVDIYESHAVVGGDVVLSGSEDDDVVARSAADGAERWRFPRERVQHIATDGQLVFVTDRAPRWRHWLVLLGVSAW